MNPRSRDTVHLRLLRTLDWGQIAAYDPDDGEQTRIIEELHISPQHMEQALALADRWTLVKMPSLLAAEQAEVVAAPGAMVACSGWRSAAPRGVHLAELISKTGLQDEKMLAGLFLDLAVALQHAHNQGLIAGNIAPELLSLSPGSGRQRRFAPFRSRPARAFGHDGVRGCASRRSRVRASVCLCAGARARGARRAIAQHCC